MMNRVNGVTASGCLLGMCLLCVAGCGGVDEPGVVDEAAEARPMNVLFITIDDLRPQLGCYGDTVVRSPNIDRLARESIVFDRAYCQVPLCGPSRISFLTGMYPSTTGARSNQSLIRELQPDVVTLPQLFKNHGYTAAGLYKIFHLVGFDPGLFDDRNDPESWSVPLWTPSGPAWGPEGQKIYDEARKKVLATGEPITYRNMPRSLAFEAPDVADHELKDGETTVEAIRRLEKLRDEPFFLAVGYYKPHLPFVAPKRYWDLYDRKSLELPENQFAPEGLPAEFLPDLTELRANVNIPNEGDLPEDIKLSLLHGYLACVSYIDAQVGLLLQALDRLGLRENTIVVLLGDHGYQIGEHNLWCKKHTNFEMATRVPLMISDPGRTGEGLRTRALVELVDVYPTLAELCGLKAPGDLDGSSLLPLIKDPKAPWAEFAFTTYGYTGAQNAVRTDRYRLNRRTRSDGFFFELYDHEQDPGENRNVATAEANASTVERLAEMVEKMVDDQPPSD